ncbi:MAG: chemotaxis protein CheW [Myxococcales bacterium]|jgi:purine-binding chemotaxis protein CheW
MAEQAGSKLDFQELYRRLDDAEKALTRGGGESAEERQRVLSARAKALSGSRSDEVRHAMAPVLAFRVGGERYAVPIDEVDEVLEVKGLAPLFGAPRQLLGAIVARSRIIPVLDLRQLLGLERGGMSDLTRVVAVGRADDIFGLAVEEIEGKLDLRADGWQRPLAGPFLHVAADRLAVLDLARLNAGEAAKAGGALAHG